MTIALFKFISTIFSFVRDRYDIHFTQQRHNTDQQAS